MSSHRHSIIANEMIKLEFNTTVLEMTVMLRVLRVMLERMDTQVLMRYRGTSAPGSEFYVGQNN
jgi:hypothetical protein